MNGLKWIALSLLTVSVSAASEHLVLRLDSGDEAFPLAEIGKVTFSDNALSVHVDGRVCQYDFAEIGKLFFGDGQGTVAELNADGLLFRCEGGAVRVDGLASPVSAFVVDMSGRILIAEGRWDGSPLRVDMLPDGVYVLLCGNAAFKFAL